MARLGLPLMVKPARGGSALGCTVVRDGRRSCPAAMVNAFAYGDTALVERFVVGTEVAVPVVDDGDGPAGAAGRGDPRRTAGSTTTPPATPPGSTEFVTSRRRCRRRSPAECARVALAAHEALGLRDLSRSDLIVDADGAGVVPRGQRRPGLHRDLDGAAVDRRPPASTSATVCASLVHGRRSAREQPAGVSPCAT